jgi:hypothetical protein
MGLVLVLGHPNVTHYVLGVLYNPLGLLFPCDHGDLASVFFLT